MKILVVGPNGQVGREICSTLPNRILSDGAEPETVLANRNDLDLVESSKISSFLEQVSPDFIVNASAYTSVDKAESEEDIAFSVNAEAVGEMAKYCLATGCRLIHISTDYVFEGKSNTPYLETDSVGPVGVYGRSKLDGENAIRKEVAQHIILRTSWIFGASGNNFVKTMVRLAESKDEFGVVADQFGAPTSARAIAKTIAIITSQLTGAHAKDPRWGTYHFSGYPFVSWADFADEIFEQAASRDLIKSRPKVNKIGTVDYPTPAARPANSRLDCSKLKSAFGIDPDDWRRSLGEVLDDLKKVKAL